MIVTPPQNSDRPLFNTHAKWHYKIESGKSRAPKSDNDAQFQLSIWGDKFPKKPKLSPISFPARAAALSVESSPNPNPLNLQTTTTTLSQSVAKWLIIDSFSVTTLVSVPHPSGHHTILNVILADSSRQPVCSVASLGQNQWRWPSRVWPSYPLPNP